MLELQWGQIRGKAIRTPIETMIRVVATRTPIGTMTKTVPIRTMTEGLPVRTMTSMPTKATPAVLRCAHTATTLIILMLARRMASTARGGLQAEYLSAPDLGITGDGVILDTGAADSTDARVGAMDEAMLVATPAVTSAAVTTVVAAGIADGELERLNIQQRIILPALHPENTTPSPENPDPGRHPHGTSRR